MAKMMCCCLTRRKSAKIIVLALALIVLVITILPQNTVAAEDREVINASEILGNITRGETVKIENADIRGDLDITEWRKDLDEIEVNGIPRRVVESEISIRNSKIEGTVNFNPIYFNNTVEFENVIFEGGVSFFYATFDKRTNFQDSTFKSSAKFDKATFNDIAYFNRVNFMDVRFRNATFNNATWFGFSTVHGEYAVFDNTFFNKSAFFTSFTVTGYTQCINVTFNDSVDFRWASFGRTVIFRKTTFNESADFLWVTFDGQVSFDDAVFKAPVNFVQATFSDTTSFQNAHFYDTANFILARFKDRTYFTDAVFNDSVDFSEADIFQTMKINWSQLDGKLVYNDYFYQSLLRNFETLGQSEDWQDAYYEYHVEKRKHLPLLGFRRPLERVFLDSSCGYGVRPLKTIRGAFIVIGLFAVLYRLIEEKESVQRLGEHSLKDKINNCWRRLWKFIFLSVSIFTTLGILNNRKSAENRKTWFRFFVIIEVFLGWIIMTLFVISLTLTWIR